MSATAVILAAGRGDRMQARVNKILLSLGDHPLICWTVRAFSQISEIKDLILVAHASEMKAIKLLIEPIAPSTLRVIAGGATRRDSAIAGVRAAQGNIVLIHDGARPFPSSALIRNVITAAQEHKAVIPVLATTDFLHHFDPANEVITSLRDSNTPYVQAQTPQAFHRDLILECLESAPSEIRDDASAILLAGHAVAAIHGERTNIKVTHPDDLVLAEAIASFRSP